MRMHTRRRTEQARARECHQRNREIRTAKQIFPAGVLSMMFLALAFAGGCSIGPKYERPATQAPAAYKELTPADFPQTDGWKVAQPSDAALHGKWWERFNDPELNALEEQVSVSNQNIAAAAASFLEARALVKEARSQYYPDGDDEPQHHGPTQPARVQQIVCGIPASL